MGAFWLEYSTIYMVDITRVNNYDYLITEEGKGLVNDQQLALRLAIGFYNVLLRAIQMAIFFLELFLKKSSACDLNTITRN